MRVIIDVTQLVNWQGKLTGIPRVMYEVASRFDAAVYIKWNHATKSFETVDSIERQKSELNAETISPDDTLDMVAYSKKVIRKLYRHSPAPIKRQARRFYQKVRTNEAAVATVNQFTFQPGDKFLVLWGDWGDSNYRATLRQLATVQKVAVYQIAYDMLPLVTPQFSSHSTESLGRYVEEVYPICTKIISISENTKKEVVQWMKDRGLTVPPIEIIRLGDDFKFAKPAKPQHEFFARKTPYILCVGTIEARKNHALLYYVYKLALERGIALPRLVIVGRQGWLTENIYELMTKDPAVKDSFVFLHNTSDEELSWIYDHSLFSIYPSFYEGWGLPIAESVARGVPNICSNTSSMPEVAGDLVTYFTPVSSDDCLTAITSLLDDKTREVAKSRLSTYKQASWDTTFQQVARIIGVKV